MENGWKQQIDTVYQPLDAPNTCKNSQNLNCNDVELYAITSRCLYFWSIEPFVNRAESKGQTIGPLIGVTKIVFHCRWTATFLAWDISNLAVEKAQAEDSSQWWKDIWSAFFRFFAITWWILWRSFVLFGHQASNGKGLLVMFGILHYWKPPLYKTMGYSVDWSNFGVGSLQPVQIQVCFKLAGFCVFRNLIIALLKSVLLTPLSSSLMQLKKFDSHHSFQSPNREDD